MSIQKWLTKNTRSLSGKTVAVSGATGGLGRALCRHLASLGASLVLLDRNPQKSETLERELLQAFPDLSISRIRLDMAEISTVKAAAEELLKFPLDALILNSGAYSIPRHTCNTGYDNVYQINFVSPYFLARTLLPHLRKFGGRVIAVGSIAHNYSKTDEGDLDFATRKRASLVYGNAKRHLMLSLPALSERKGEVVIVHPGISFTGITAHYPKVIFALIKHPMKVIFMKPRKACLSILRGLFEDCEDGEWIGPRAFDVWGYPKKRRLCTYTATERDFIRAHADSLFKKLYGQE